MNELDTTPGQAVNVDAIVSRLPRTADGVPIVPGDTVFFRDQDVPWPESIAQIVTGIYLGLGFDEYKGTHTIMGDDCEAGNLECWASLAAFKKDNEFVNG